MSARISWRPFSICFVVHSDCWFSQIVKGRNRHRVVALCSKPFSRRQSAKLYIDSLHSYLRLRFIYLQRRVTLDASCSLSGMVCGVDCRVEESNPIYYCLRQQQITGQLKLTSWRFLKSPACFLKSVCAVPCLFLRYNKSWLFSTCFLLISLMMWKFWVEYSQCSCWLHIYRSDWRGVFWSGRKNFLIWMYDRQSLFQISCRLASNSYFFVFINKLCRQVWAVGLAGLLIVIQWLQSNDYSGKCRLMSVGIVGRIAAGNFLFSKRLAEGDALVVINWLLTWELKVGIRVFECMCS